MDPSTLRLIQGAAGAAGESATYVDDVFSCFLYEGTGSEQAINNGIDLSGKGGIAWVKCRSAIADHRLIDTDGGANNILTPNNTTAYFNNSTIFSSFNSNGFSVATDVASNGSGRTFVSWSFRKAPGFFDVVTYTGNDVAGREISHSLGSVPGMILIKVTNADDSWLVWHRSFPNNGYARLNTTAAAVTTNTQFKFGNGTIAVAPTSTSFTVGNDSDINSSSNTYVAYIFAHDDQSFGTDSDEAIIKCGTYTGSGSAGKFVNVGFEPQWVLIKCTSEARDWVIRDNMRFGQEIYPNLTDADKNEPYFDFSANGFTLQDSSARHNKSSATYIYVAIRRPNKPPVAATEVFDVDAFSGSGSAPVISTPFTVDASLTAWRNRNYVPTLVDRIRGGDKEVYTAGSNQENPNTNPAELDFQTGLQLMDYAGDIGYNLVSYSFKRAPGFFDVVAYTGTGSNRTVDHNLGIAPDLMLVKRRDATGNWRVYSSAFGGTHVGIFNLDNAFYTSSGYWNDTDATDSVFTVGFQGNTNASGGTFIAYLFATLDGISKVGTYSGTGSDVNVDCGFSAGARFVLIKRTDSTGDWYVYDTARGIVSGNDEYLLLNEDGTTTTPGTDYLDPLNSGFTVTSSAPAGMNASGGTYLFLAIA